MEYKISTAIVTEPISLAQAKMHLRLSSDTLSGDMVINQSIKPGAHVQAASFGLLGSAIDVLGKSALVVLNAAACGAGGSIAEKIQESDNGTTWLDYTGGAFTTVTEDNDNAVQEIEYTGTKRYIRVIATVAGATCEFGSDVITMTGDVTEDDLLSDIITAAREYCENITGRSLAAQTITAYLDSFPWKNYIELPRAPLTSVTSIIYKNSVGTSTPMTVNTDYYVDTDRDIGRIVLPTGKSWPTFTPWPVNPITIIFVTGYTTMPKTIKQAMLMLITYWFDNRETIKIGVTSQEIAFSTTSLLSQNRDRWF